MATMLEESLIVVSVTVNPSEPPIQHHAALAQAPVKALDPDGFSVIVGGTVCFLVATGVLWALAGDLAASGNLWRLWIAITGSAFGVLALVLTLTLGRRRRAERRRLRDAAEAEAE